MPPGNGDVNWTGHGGHEGLNVDVGVGVVGNVGDVGEGDVEDVGGVDVDVDVGVDVGDVDWTWRMM